MYVLLYSKVSNRSTKVLIILGDKYHSKEKINPLKLKLKVEGPVELRTGFNRVDIIGCEDIQLVQKCLVIHSKKVFQLNSIVFVYG